MTKLDEKVMVVEAQALFAAGRWQGLRMQAGPWLEHIFEPRHSRFLPRSRAEEDPAWKQVIPYVILAAGDEVFVYRRGQRSTETRLRALESAGLGGHIRHDDEDIFHEPCWPAYQAALERELAEEVEVDCTVIEDRLVGLINDDSTPVGQVHIGLVHIRRLAAPRVRARESKIAAGRFVVPARLRADGLDGFESWSQFVLERWDELTRQPGWTPTPWKAR
ncbi:MAG: hypothetical protein ACRD2D_10045 [Terriglobales bacterium]